MPVIKSRRVLHIRPLKSHGLVGGEPTPMWFRGRGPKIKP